MDSTIKQNKKIEIDASGKKPGRVASEVAHCLLGKDSPLYERHTIASTVVHITHASQMDITEKKRITKTYKRFSGYPSGLKIITMDKLVSKKGYSEVLRKAVRNMLPANKLRPHLMKQLIISE